MIISLPDPQLLEITGTDAVNFAHAQFSSDVRGLENGTSQWSAWLSPQGRVRAFFHLIRDSDQRLRLLLRGGRAESLRVALAPYVMRAKVVLQAIDDARVFGTDETSAAAFALPGTPPRRLILDTDQSTADKSPQAREAWRLADIRAGWPHLSDNLLDQLLPQWLGLDRLGAISVKKGCYPGQEVMSRLHFKGGNKRSLYRLRLDANAAPGAALATASGETAGQIVMTARRDDGDYEALAALNVGLAGTPVVKAIVLEQFG
jgi:folate-binding protein YgfZ